MIFKGNPNIAVPKVYNNLTTERVLTMSFERGIPATHVKEMHAQGIDLKKAAKIISEAFSFMIYEKSMYKVNLFRTDHYLYNLFFEKATLNQIAYKNNDK